ncbi:MAG: phosphate ABC transporter substrate-binding protein PstS family protein [Halodesulfurarchaeum sp.]
MARDDGRSGLTRRQLLAGTGATGAAILAGCTSTNDGGTDTGLSGDISVSGSSTVFPLAEAVAEKFGKKHPQVNVAVKSTGTGGGFKNNFCPGNSEFNNASRQITQTELQQCSENGVEPLELKVATDALTVVVNNDAEWIDCVTLDELAQLWSEEGPNTWAGINSEWPEKEIKRFGPASTSGTFDYFREVVLSEEQNHTSDYQPTEHDNLIVQGVQGSKYGIGYFGFAYYYNNPGSVKALAIDSGSGCVKPSIETAKSGEYEPLSRPLFTYAAKDALAKRHVAEFARFYVEQSGNQQLVADRVGYVPNSETTVQNQLEKLETAIQNAG